MKKLMDGSFYPFIAPLGGCWREGLGGLSGWEGPGLQQDNPPPLLHPAAPCPVSLQTLVAPSPPCPLPLPAGLTTVDLDDVAAAHVLAMVLPQAKGRYLLCERSTLMTEVAALLRWVGGEAAAEAEAEEEGCCGHCRRCCYCC